MPVKQAPLVSVIMPQYNHSMYLPVSLHAIAQQSFQDLEVVIVDDASTDQSVKIIKKHQKQYFNVKLLQNTENCGVIKTFQKGLMNAQGKYIVCCSADDWIAPGFIEKGVWHLEKNYGSGIFVSDMAFFGDEERKVRLLDVKQAVVLSPFELIDVFKSTGFWIPGNASIYKKDLFFKYGGLNHSLNHLADWYLNCTIALSHGVVYLPETLAYMRKHKKAYSVKLDRRKKEKNDIFKNLFRLLNEEHFYMADKFKKAGVFSQLGKDIFLFGLLYPPAWKLLGPAFLKKLKNKFLQLGSGGGK